RDDVLARAERTLDHDARRVQPAHRLHDDVDLCVLERRAPVARGLHVARLHAPRTGRVADDDVPQLEIQATRAPQLPAARIQDLDQAGADVAQPVQCDAHGHAGLRSFMARAGSSASWRSAAAGSAWSGRTYSVRPSSLMPRPSGSMPMRESRWSARAMAAPHADSPVPTTVMRATGRSTAMRAPLPSTRAAAWCASSARSAGTMAVSRRAPSSS